MLDGWRRHLSGRNASVLAFFGFLSIFPLMLAATTILGFVLEGNQDLQQRIIDGALDDIPVLGEQLQSNPAALEGNWWALIIGLGGALWSSTKAFVGLQLALDDVWEVSVDHRDAMPKQRGKALLGLLIIGAAQIGTIAIAAVVNAAGLPMLGRFALLGTTVVVNVAVLAAMYRYLTAANTTWSDVWPGAIGAGIAFSVLQYFGTAIVDRIRDERFVDVRQLRRRARARDLARLPGHLVADDGRTERCDSCADGRVARSRPTARQRRPSERPAQVSA